MKYKYKVGQKVRYYAQKYTETVCKTCGHEETDSKTIKVTGVILKRYYDIVFRWQPFPLTDEITEDKNGKIIHKPYLSDTKINKPEPCYEIERSNGDNSVKTEDQIIKILE